MEFQYQEGQVTFCDAIKLYSDKSFSELLGVVREDPPLLVSSENITLRAYNFYVRYLKKETGAIEVELELNHFSKINVSGLLKIKGLGLSIAQEFYNLYAKHANQQSSAMVLNDTVEEVAEGTKEKNINFCHYSGHYKVGQITFAAAWDSQTTQKIGELLGKIDNPQLISSRELRWRTHDKLQAYLTLYSYEADQNYGVIGDISLVDLSFDRSLQLSEIEEIYEAYAKYAIPTLS
jgi:hypothetical protein